MNTRAKKVEWKWSKATSSWKVNVSELDTENDKILLPSGREVMSGDFVERTGDEGEILFWELITEDGKMVIFNDLLDD